MNLRLYLDQVFTPYNAIVTPTAMHWPPIFTVPAPGLSFYALDGQFSKVHSEYLNEDGQKHAHHIWSVTPLYTFPGLGLPPALQPGCHTEDGQCSWCTVDT